MNKPNDISQFKGKIQEIRTLGLKNDQFAKELLTKAARQVQPIMKKRDWTVPLLSEFVPSSPNLLGLNINGGEEIKVRLRRPNSAVDDFFNYEHVLGTLLHELTHIVHGPHNASFYKMLEELQNECDSLMEKGISGSGQGFDVDGARLGGISHNPTSMREGREKALKAAEERQKMRTLMGNGPQKLGGSGFGSGDSWKSQSPRDAAANAAMRRHEDDKWCGGAQVVDLTNDSPPPYHKVVEEEQALIRKTSSNLQSMMKPIVIVDPENKPSSSTNTTSTTNTTLTAPTIKTDLNKPIAVVSSFDANKKQALQQSPPPPISAPSFPPPPIGAPSFPPITQQFGKWYCQSKFVIMISINFLDLIVKIGFFFLGCTLENLPGSKDCVLCNTPREYQQPPSYVPTQQLQQQHNQQQQQLKSDIPVSPLASWAPKAKGFTCAACTYLNLHRNSTVCEVCGWNNFTTVPNINGVPL